MSNPDQDHTEIKPVDAPPADLFRFPSDAHLMNFGADARPSTAKSAIGALLTLGHRPPLITVEPSTLAKAAGLSWLAAYLAVYHPDVAAAALTYHTHRADEKRTAAGRPDDPDATEMDAVSAALKYNIDESADATETPNVSDPQ